jgi:putative cell wall-binding protein/Leucine-rich repeat (LRR) protein
MNMKLRKALSRCITLALLTILIFPNKTYSLNYNDASNTKTSQNLKSDDEVEIPDQALKEALILKVGEPITRKKLSELKNLEVRLKEVSNIEGLQYCTSLESLVLFGNKIEKINQLEGLTSLKLLNLTSNKISDISPLKNLTSLEILDIQVNKISDISPLREMSSLTTLSLFSNNVSDLKPLKDLKKLTKLYLVSNNIRDLSPLEEMTQLVEIQLPNNKISDLGPLSKLTSLEFLTLQNNYVTDIIPLQNLKSLKSLSLHNNKVTDLNTLRGLTSLTYLDVSKNNISDITPIENLTSISKLSLENQSIKLNPVFMDTSEYTTVTPIKLWANGILAQNEIINISPNTGIYDGYGNLSWTGLNNTGTLKYEFNYQIKAGVLFSGTVEQNYAKKIGRPPQISGAVDKTIFEGDDFDPMYGVTAYDEEDGDITHRIQISGNVDINNAGEFEVTYSVADKDNNTITVTIKVTVKSNTPPEIRGTESKTIQVGDTYDPSEGVTAYDKEDGDLTDKIQINSDVNTNKAGEYKVTYKVADSNGNEVMEMIIVTVKNKSGGGGSVDPDPVPLPQPSVGRTVILASGEKYTDVLTATVLGNEKSAPILLSNKDSVTSETLVELKRLNTQDIIISGGVDSVSNKVVEQLKDYNVTRIAGKDRYETAVKIGNEVRELSGNITGTMLVDGTNFPDVITISSLASQKKVPILITAPEELDRATQDTLKSWDIKDVTIGGSYNSVSRNVENSLNVRSVKRLGGADRYETASIIGDEIKSLTGSKVDMILVDGTNFPDGITINSIAAKYKAPIMLTDPENLTNVTSGKISEWSIRNILIGGGYNSVSKAIENNLKVSNIERIAGKDRYETAVKIAHRLTEENKALGGQVIEK